MRRVLIALLPLLLTACVRDTATYYVDKGSNQHTLSLRRQQDYFWNDNVNLILVAARMPDCQRQIPLGDALVDEVDIEVFAAPENHWSLHSVSANQTWQVETNTCALIGEGGAVTGDKVGAFKVDARNKLVFEEAPAPAVPPAPAPAPAPAASEPAPAH